MSRITRIVVALAVLLTATLLGSNGPATAATGYGASYSTRLTVKVDALRGYDKPIRIKLQVSSDAAGRTSSNRGGSFRAVGDFTGTAAVSIDGAAARTVDIAANGAADLDIPCSSLKPGAHTVSAAYTPASDSVYQSATGSTGFTSTLHCVPAKAKTTKHDGGLPTTGGPWLGILAIALLLLLLGAWLVRRKTAEN